MKDNKKDETIIITIFMKDDNQNLLGEQILNMAFCLCNQSNSQKGQRSVLLLLVKMII